MGEEVLTDSAQEQAHMESRLLAAWAQGVPETGSAEQVFGPYEDWLLPLGTHLLLLHPVRREWLVLDRLHDTWQPTGFGPDEVVFVALGRRLGFRTRKRSPATSTQSTGQRTAATAQGDLQTPTLCVSCGAQLRPGNKFCTQCGVALS